MIRRCTNDNAFLRSDWIWLGFIVRILSKHRIASCIFPSEYKDEPLLNNAEILFLSSKRTLS